MIEKHLHLISNGNFSNHHLPILKEIQHDIDFLHIREKEKTAKQLMDSINSLIGIGFPLSKIIINDRIDVAYMMKCAGVQLAYHSACVSAVKKHFPSMLCGKSVHSVKEAKRAEEEGADFLLYGHIFASNSKPNQVPRGLIALNRLIDSVAIPVYAIGGITPALARDILKCNASGIAIMSGIWEAAQPLQAVKAYRKVLKEARRDRYE